MKRIYLMRHGQSEGNKTGIVQGTNDSHLSEKGIMEAEAVSKRFKKFKIDKIYTSELARARETAEIIGKEHGVEVEVVPEFIELSFGVWQGVDFDIIKTKYKEEFNLWKKSPHKFDVEGFEGIENGKKRMLKGLKRVAEKDGCENILIVSHGSALKCLIIGLLELENSVYKNMVMANTGLSLIERGDYNTIVRFYDDYSHLDALD